MRCFILYLVSSYEVALVSGSRICGQAHCGIAKHSLTKCTYIRTVLLGDERARCSLDSCSFLFRQMRMGPSFRRIEICLPSLMGKHTHRTQQPSEEISLILKIREIQMTLAPPLPSLRARQALTLPFLSTCPSRVRKVV